MITINKTYNLLKMFLLHIYNLRYKGEICVKLSSQVYYRSVQSGTNYLERLTSYLIFKHD